MIIELAHRYVSKLWHWPGNTVLFLLFFFAVGLFLSLFFLRSFFLVRNLNMTLRILST